MFSTTYCDIIKKVQEIDPIAYGKTRNYTNGAVTYLSPYISRGVISTKQILEITLQRGYKPKQIEKFIQELAWRGYWQQVWIAKKDGINTDLKQKQHPVLHHAIPKAIITANTQITALDKAIASLYQTGYMHNHLRMYIASVACNIAKSHWLTPAKWLYYHLLDADWASNALSWQWVAGANANKKYIANQQNINTYCFTQDKNTFLDISYPELAEIEVPKILQEQTTPVLKTVLPTPCKIQVDTNLPTCIYNFYNLDPVWMSTTNANRVLLLEPSIFKTYPVSSKSIAFAMALAKENIKNIQIYVGEFSDFVKEHPSKAVHYKEHPLSVHYKGIVSDRDWMFKTTGYYPSFFAFWKRCKKEISF